MRLFAFWAMCSERGCCRCCITYLQVLIKAEIMPQGEAPPSLELAPGFKAPVPTDYASMKEYIETALPAESPIMYGMHTNAELSLLTSQVIFSPSLPLMHLPCDDLSG